ncbi:hypothetical protein EC968_009075 [Mortierella alpina]|nr:hypothetical protein EC968_009075 [Mortierella alpina]
MRQQAQQKSGRQANHITKMSIQFVQAYARREAHNAKMQSQQEGKAARAQKHEALMREQAGLPVDDFEEDMILDEDDLIAPSPTGEEHFEEAARFGSGGGSGGGGGVGRTPNIPGQPAGWRVYWPHWNLFLVSLAAGVSSFFYIYFFPDTRISLFQWMKNTVGIETVRSCVHFAIGLHSFQSVTAIYLMKSLSAYKFSLKQTVIWTVCVQFFGIGSMLKLLPIVYNSKFVRDELEREEKSSRMGRRHGREGDPLLAVSAREL